MTEKHMDQDDLLKDATIGDLRALAKSYGIQAQRDWTKPDYIKPIAVRQSEGATPDLHTDDGEADRLIASYSLAQDKSEASAAKGVPKPGFARIIIHKDPTPNHSNSAVQVGLNGRFFNIPRGAAVELPIPYLGVLRDAVHKQRRQIKEPDANNLEGVVTEEEILSYPFQIVSLTPGGKFVNQEDQRSVSASRRAAFHKDLGRWPTDGELIEWEKANAARAARAN